MKRRHFILLLGGGSSGALSVGTGAFSSASAERDVAVNVVDDEKAYVGYEEADKTIPADLRNDGTVHLVTITNRFSRPISIVNVEIGDSADKLTDVSYDDSSFEPGERAEITGEVEGLDHGESVEVEITVTVQGTGVTAQLFGDTETRRFTIAREELKVEFSGTGDAEVLGAEGTVSVDVHLLGENATSVTDITNEDVDASTTLRNQVSDADDSDKIVGVTLDDTTYIHPEWNPDDCGLDGSTGGRGDPSDSPPSCT
ncbi:hypothetical protein [Halobellus ruber]|uniref:Uncharacterized protein n=1 Tax=Halobellus ruber TaxID=2761102 RepID=A0A7J9SIS0_9EURY|nr:hypothetical protein [Halobellus ruber]MBB6646628.1 hypothetical protein [Halobellus ruber]